MPRNELKFEYRLKYNMMQKLNQISILVDYADQQIFYLLFFYSLIFDEDGEPKKYFRYLRMISQ